jgi:hypothetical protein
MRGEDILVECIQSVVRVGSTSSLIPVRSPINVRDFTPPTTPSVPFLCFLFCLFNGLLIVYLSVSSTYDHRTLKTSSLVRSTRHQGTVYALFAAVHGF